jgi:hypothetical protein
LTAAGGRAAAKKSVFRQNGLGSGLKLRVCVVSHRLKPELQTKASPALPFIVAYGWMYHAGRMIE